MSWVMTIDGASGSGKTALATMLATRLNATLLPSGVLYRLLALWHEEGMELDQMPILSIHQHLGIKMDNGLRVAWMGQDMTSRVMSDQTAHRASVLAQQEAVRHRLIGVQRAWPNTKGLIAEGRDMGSVIFPDAMLKWFVSCDAQTRAKRRVQQLLDHGIHANFGEVVQEILARDLRDQSRDIAPLHTPDGAICVENVRPITEQVDEMVRIFSLRIGAISRK